MRDKVFVDTAEILNWIPENDTGDIEGTKTSMNVMETLLPLDGQTVILVDLTKAKRASPEQRDQVIETLRRNMSRIKKIAIFGHGSLMKAVAYFIINTSGFQNMRFFTSRHEATSWLQQEKA